LRERWVFKKKKQFGFSSFCLLTPSLSEVFGLTAFIVCFLVQIRNYTSGRYRSFSFSWCSRIQVSLGRFISEQCSLKCYCNKSQGAIRQGPQVCPLTMVQFCWLPTIAFLDHCISFWVREEIFKNKKVFFCNRNSFVSYFYVRYRYLEYFLGLTHRHLSNKDCLMGAYRLPC
jgi:hypothetical protein